MVYYCPMMDEMDEFADMLNRLIYGDDSPRIDIGLITLIPEDEREAWLASLIDWDEEED